MSTLLLKNAKLLITMDPQRRQIENGGLFVRNSVIEQGVHAELPATARSSDQRPRHGGVAGRRRQTATITYTKP